MKVSELWTPTFDNLTSPKLKLDWIISVKTGIENGSICEGTLQKMEEQIRSYET